MKVVLLREEDDGDSSTPRTPSFLYLWHDHDHDAPSSNIILFSSVPPLSAPTSDVLAALVEQRSVVDGGTLEADLRAP